MRRKIFLPATAVLSSTGRLLSKVASKVALYFQLTVRFLHVHIILRATKWSKKQEDAKVLLFKDRRIAPLSTLVHMIPLATALAFLVINIRPTYIGDVSTSAIAALQFCAKLWEVLMQASITTIVLSMVRTQVVASSAIPLGVFLVPYRVIDVSFLWSLEFWAAVASRQFPLWRKALVLTTIAMAVILGAVVGPSGAIAMIPRHITFALPPSLVILSGEALYYPEEIALEGGQLANEATVNTNFYQVTSFDGILRPLDDTLHSSAISNDMTNLYFRSATVCNPAKCFAATVPHRVAAFVFSFAQPWWTGFNSRDAKILRIGQPFVSQSSITMSVSPPEGTSLDLNSIPVSFGDDYPTLNNVLTFANLLPGSPAPSSEYCQDFSVFFNPDINQTLAWCGGGHASHNFSLLMAQMHYEGIEQTGSQPRWVVSACGIRAQWAQTAVNLTASSSMIASVDSLKELGDSKAPFLRVQSSWAERATLLHIQASQNTSAYDPYDPDYPWSKMHTIVAVALSDIGPSSGDSAVSLFFDPKNLTIITGDPSQLSQTQYDFVESFLRDQHDLHKFSSVAVQVGLNDTFADSSSLTRFEIHKSLPGYGYDASNVTVRLALAVLATYACVVVFHLCYSLISGWVGTSWDSIGELVMLCLNSKRPRHLEGTSVGVDTLYTYSQSINVRINRENSAEIVFDDDPALQKAEYTQVEANKKYL